MPRKKKTPAKPTKSKADREAAALIRELATEIALALNFEKRDSREFVKVVRAIERQIDEKIGESLRVNKGLHAYASRLGILAAERYEKMELYRKRAGALAARIRRVRLSLSQP